MPSQVGDIIEAGELIAPTGIPGGDLYCFVVESFLAPDLGGSVDVHVDNTNWIIVGYPLFVSNMTYVVTSIDRDNRILSLVRIQSEPRSTSLPTRVTESFQEPAVGGSVTVPVNDSTWLDVGLPVFIQGFYFVITSIEGNYITIQRT